MGYQRLAQGAVALLCVLFPVWGSVVLLLAVHSTLPDYPLWPAPAPTPSPPPPPLDSRADDEGQDDRGASSEKVKSLEQRLAVEKGELVSARAKFQQAESELKRALAGSDDSADLKRQLLEERRRRQAAEAAASEARSAAVAARSAVNESQAAATEAQLKVSKLRKELEDAQQRQSFSGPVLDFLQVLDQPFLAALLGLLGAAGLLGPRQFVWMFCPAAGSILAGLLVASCVGVCASVFSSASSPGGSLGWADAVLGLLAGSAGSRELLVWACSSAFGLLRWLYQWNCYYYAEVDLDGPFEDGPLEEPLLKYTRGASEACDSQLRGLQSCDSQLRGLRVGCSLPAVGSCSGAVGRLADSMPWPRKGRGDEVEPEPQQGDRAEEKLGPLERKPSASPSQISSHGSRKPSLQGQPPVRSASHVSGQGSHRAPSQQGGPSARSGTRSEVSGSQGLFEQLDVNQDGFISPEEWNAIMAAQEVPRTSSSDGRVRPPPIQGMPTGGGFTPSGHQQPRSSSGGHLAGGAPPGATAPAALAPFQAAESGRSGVRDDV